VSFPTLMARLPLTMLPLATIILSLLSCAPSSDSANAANLPLLVFEPAVIRPVQDTRAFEYRASLNAGTMFLSIPEPFWPAPRDILEVPEPISTCPRYVLAWPQRYWRNSRFELFRWYRFPSLLIFDTADYDVQDRLLKRIAFFVEKRGFRGRLAHDEEIADLHGWNAHDYRSEDLARFFQTARMENFPLNREELELEQILLNTGLMWETLDGLQGGEGGILSISREAPEFLRFLFMAHEGFHGLFYIDEDFREFTANRWYWFPEDGQRMFLTFLDDQEYDITVEFIVLKEFASFLLQQPVSMAPAYFGRRMPYRITNPYWHAENRHLRDHTGAFPHFANMFTREAEAFSAYVNYRWGFAAGRVW